MDNYFPFFSFFLNAFLFLSYHPIPFSCTTSLCVSQNEKCHLLIEHETQKLKELDEEHSLELKEWREKLRPRKKVQVCSVQNISPPHANCPKMYYYYTMCSSYFHSSYHPITYLIKEL